MRTLTGPPVPRTRAASYRAAGTVGVLESNPARGKRRRLKVVKPVRRQLEADDLKELLAVAGEMDRNLYRGHRIGRRPMIAAMAKSGLRVTEMCRLRWRDVDVHHERLVIDEAKTDAGNRHVDLSLDVMEELMAWRAERQPASPDEYVFATASGRPRDKENISRRVLGPTVKRANELRAERDLPPLPKVTPHALRRTYIGLMIEADAPLPCVVARSGTPTRERRSRSAPGAEATGRSTCTAAFDDLLASAGSADAVEVRPPAATRCRSRPTIQPSAPPRPPREKPLLVHVVHALVHASNDSHPRMTHSQGSAQAKPRNTRLFGVEPTEFEPVTSCFPKARGQIRCRSDADFAGNAEIYLKAADHLTVGSRRQRLSIGFHAFDPNPCGDSTAARLPRRDGERVVEASRPGGSSRRPRPAPRHRRGRRRYPLIRLAAADRHTQRPTSCSSIACLIVAIVYRTLGRCTRILR